MDLTQLANLGEFIGGVAVLVTLIYLALQVRQSTSAQRTAAELAVADLTYKTVSAYSTIYEMLADEGLAEIWAKAQRDEEISATEGVRLRAMVGELTYASVAAAWNYYGVAGRGKRDVPHAFVAQELGTARKMREAWTRMEAELLNSDLGDFAREVAARLAPEVPA